MVDRDGYVEVGDVVYLHENECELLGGFPVGEYVVEDARDTGGWTVEARKLDIEGKYCENNPLVRFHQCPGYRYSLLKVRVVRQMSRIFV